MCFCFCFLLVNADRRNGRRRLLSAQARRRADDDAAGEITRKLMFDSFVFNLRLRYTVQQVRVSLRRLQEDSALQSRLRSGSFFLRKVTFVVYLFVRSRQCKIDGVCYNNFDKNPKNACQQCLVSTSSTAWSSCGAFRHVLCFFVRFHLSFESIDMLQTT